MENINKHNKINLSLKERKTIEKFIKRGDSLTSISYKLGRGKNTIISEVRNNGGILNYNANKAQKAYEMKKEIANEKRKEFSKTQEPPFNSLMKKVQSIEFELEILWDILKNRNEL